MTAPQQIEADLCSPAWPMTGRGEIPGGVLRYDVTEEPEGSMKWVSTRNGYKPQCGNC